VPARHLNQSPVGLVTPAITPALPRAILAPTVLQEHIQALLPARVPARHLNQSPVGLVTPAITPALPRAILALTVLQEHIQALLPARTTASSLQLPVGLVI